MLLCPCDHNARVERIDTKKPSPRLGFLMSRLFEWFNPRRFLRHFVTFWTSESGPRKMKNCRCVKTFRTKDQFSSCPRSGARWDIFHNLDTVEKIVHFVKIFFVGSVEPIWSDTLRMFFCTLSDFAFRISFVEETWVKFRNYTHDSSSTILWSHSITFSQRESKLSSRLGGKSSEATPLRHSFKRACCSELSVIVNWSLNFISL